MGNDKNETKLTNAKYKTGHRIDLARDINQLERYRIPPKMIEILFKIQPQQNLE